VRTALVISSVSGAMVFPESINTASIERFGILYLTVVHYISIRAKLTRYKIGVHSIHYASSFINQ
jgi:hypothetical protein